MNEIVLESFISYCDDMMIANEGLFRNKNNSIPTFTHKKASGSTFDYLVEKEAYCAEGWTDADKRESLEPFVKRISKWKGVPKELHFYFCKGRDLNKYYHLTGDNRYNDNLPILFLDWSNFPKEFEPSDYKGNFRWFSDVVDNNARREIVEHGNPHYKNYHSKYGDDWFYKTVREDLGMGE